MDTLTGLPEVKGVPSGLTAEPIKDAVKGVPAGLTAEPIAQPKEEVKGVPQGLTAHPVETQKLPFWQRAVSDEGAGKLIGAASQARQGTLDLFSNLWKHGGRPLALSDKKFAEYQQQLHDSWEHIAKHAVPLAKAAILSAPEVHGVTSEQAGEAAKAVKEPVAGMGAGGEEFAETMLTSPTQAALMVATWGGSALEQGAAKAGFPLASRAVGTVSKLMSLQFAAQMTEGAVQSAENTYHAAVDGNWYEAGKSAVEALTSGVMAHGIIDHTAAESKVHGDLDKTAQETHGKRFNDLNPYDQGLVIDETVKRSPEYQEVLKTAEAKDEEAKAQIKEKRQKKLENYYSTALGKAWEPNAAKRAIHGITQAEQVGEEARQKKIKEVVEKIKESAKARAKELERNREASLQEAREERPEKRQAVAQERTVRGKAAQEIKDTREELYSRRQEATEPETPQRHVEAVKDDAGNVSYPATFWGEENSFGVASDLSGHAIYRQTPREIEWLDASGNFSENPEEPFNSTDPEVADTVARLSSLKTAAESEGGNQQDADLLADIHRQLVMGEIDAKTAQKQAGISEKVHLPDEFNAARKGKLNGPYFNSSSAKYLSELEAEAKNAGVSEEDTSDLVKNAGLVARQQTENNLHHVYKSGDYIVSKRGVRWVLDAKGMLQPDNGGQPIPLMKNGFYSRQAVQLAESGRVGYGRSSYEDIQSLRRKNEVELEGQSPREATHERLQELAKQAGFEDTDEYLKSRRLESEALKLGFSNRAELEEHAYQMGFGNAEDFLRFKQAQRIPEDESRQLTYQKEQAAEVKDRAEGKVQDPEPQTSEEAQAQLDGAAGRTEAAQSVAVNDLLKAIDPPPTATEAEIDTAVQKAEESRKVAEQAVAQEAKAKSKLVGPGEYPQKAPITSKGFTGAQWAVGPSSVVHTNAGDIPVHLELVKPAQLTVSFRWNGNELERTPTYPEQMQDVQPDEATKTQLMKDALPQNYQATRYLDSGKGPEHGPAIIDVGGDVVGGNRRLLRLAKYLENISNDPIAMGNLRNQMREFAAANGMIYPAGDDLYIPVRMMDEPIGTLARASELGDLFNKGASHKIDAAAKAITHGRLLYEAQLAEEKAGNIGVLERIAEEFNRAETPREAISNNPTFFAEVAKKYLNVTDAERADWSNKDVQGNEVLTVEGKEKLEMALLSTVLKNPTTLEALKKSQSYQSLLKAIGPMTRLRTTEAKDITGVLEEAVEAAAQTQRKKVEGDSPKMRWNKVYVEPDMFAEGPPPPEPNRMVEAIWRAMHDDKSTRLKNALNDYLIGEGRQKNAFGEDVENKLPAELFNAAFQPELEDVRGSRGLETEGARGLKDEKMRVYLKTLPWEVTQEEFDAAREGKDLVQAVGSEHEPAAAVSESPAEASQTAEKQAEVAKTESPKFGLQPPRTDTAKAAEERLASQKQEQGYVTASQLREFLKSYPGTKAEADDLMRTATLMAEYVYDADPPVGVDRKDALEWVLRERLAGIEKGDNKTKRGEYSDPEIEKNFGTKILKLHQAADPTTFIHEFAHVIFPLLSDEDLKAIDTIGGHRLWEGRPTGNRYAEMTEKLAHGLEQFLRDENPTGFTGEVKQVLAKVKAIMRKVYLSFASDPLSKFKNTDESREVFAKMFGITAFDKADEFQKDIRKAKMEAKRIKKPSEEPHPLEKLRVEMGANGLVESMAGKVEDSVGERIDPRKPTAMLKFDDGLDAVAAFTKKVGNKGSKIQDAELIRGEDGTWGIRFNTDKKLPDILHQNLPRTREPALFNGKPFYVGAVNPLDGKIEAVSDHKTTAVFRHRGYFSPEISDQLDRGELMAFFVEPNGSIRLWSPHQDVKTAPDLEDVIRGQIKVNATLHQELPEKHPGLQLEELEKQLSETKSYMFAQKQLLELKIRNLKNRIRAEYGAEALDQKSDPELADKALEEAKNGRETANGIRKESHGVSGIQKLQGVGRISKPAFFGMSRDAGSAQRGGAKGSAVARVPASLSEVKPVSLEPMPKPRGNPVGTVTGEAFDPKGWVESLKKSGLPENAPAPTYELDPKTAAVLKFPGQKQVVQLAMSALEQGDGVVIATSTGSGKSYTAMGTVKEFLRNNPDASVLHITKNRSLLKDAQKIAENSFGIGLETDAPAGKPGVYGVSYVGLLNDKSYQNMKWDLVVADESGEARNWYQESNQQGKMLKKVVENSRKAVYLSATPFHSPMEYGYLDKLGLWPKGQFDKWIEQNFAHEKIGDRVVARLDPAKQAKLRQQLIERGQLVSQAISYDGYTAHFGVVPVTYSMKRGLDRIHEGFARARSQCLKMGKKGLAEKAAAFEATYTKAFLERERIPQAIELARQARDKGWQVMVFSETSSEDLFRRERTPGVDASTYQELDDAMGGQLSKIIPPFENVYDRLHSEFGNEIGDYSGRGNTAAEREQAKLGFMTGKQPMLYSTYAAGGIGVSLHDADFPELNIKGGDKPRVAIFLGPPYSGVLLEQAMGRSWRFGVKSDVHAVFLATDSEPDIKLMQTKVGPRMRALRAAVLGEADSLASAMHDYTDEEKVRARQDALAYAEGDEVRVNAGSYQVRSKKRDVGINNWSEINFPHAETAKNKGMKYSENVPGGDWSTLYQSKFGGMEPPPSPEEEKGKKIINEIGNAAVSGKVPEVQNLDPVDRATTTGLAAADSTVAVDAKVDRNKAATAEQGMKSGLRNNSLIRYQGVTLSQYMGMQNITRLDGKPEVGLELTRMGRSYKADWDTTRSQYWNMAEDILKSNDLWPKGLMFEGQRMKKLDAIMEQISYVIEGKKVSDNPAINRAATDFSDMMRIAHNDMAKAGVQVRTHDGQKISYSEFGEDPRYWPRRIDWDHQIPNPTDPSKMITLRKLMKPKFDETARERAISAIPELRPYSPRQVLDYLSRNDPRAPLLTNVHHAREMNFPFYRRDYSTLIGYFDQVGEAVSAAKNFGPDNKKLTSEIGKLRNPRSQNTINMMWKSVLEPQAWDDYTAKIYNFGIAFEAASKMTFSAMKLPGHLILTPLSMDSHVMPLVKATVRFAMHPREVTENAAYVGTISRQLSAADAMYGEHGSPMVRGVLKKEMFNSVYKVVRVISGESARVYLEQYALNDLRKGGTRGEATRRVLKDTMLIGDHGIDQAISTGHFTPEDMAKAQTAFANFATFSDDPLQMPMAARLHIDQLDPQVLITAKRAMRLSYALQSFSSKCVSLMREKMYDEMVIHHNFRMVPYLLVASPIVGEMINLMSQGTRHQVRKGMEGLTGTQHHKDSWDEHLAEIKDLVEHPTAWKATKELIDSVSAGYGLEMAKLVCAPFVDVEQGNYTKAEKEFKWLLPDIGEHLIGGFFDDVFIKTPGEAINLIKIRLGQKHPEQRGKKYVRSLANYAKGMFTGAAEIPQIAAAADKP